MEVASELEDASDKWLLDQVYGSVVNTKMCLCVCVCVCADISTWWRWCGSYPYLSLLLGDGEQYRVHQSCAVDT